MNQMKRKLERRALVRSLATRLDISKGAVRAPGQRFARWLLVAIIVVNVIAGSAIWLYGAHKVSARASTDLATRITVMETLIQGGGLLDPGRLALLQTQIAGAQSDLYNLQSTIPFNGLIGLPSEGTLNASLVAAEDFLAAAHDLVLASRAIQPSLTGLLVSALGVIPEQAGNGVVPTQNLDNALGTLSTDVANAQASWQSAEALLQAHGDSTVGSSPGIDAGNVNSIIQYMRNDSA
jgi:hypothetical protein